MKRRAVGIRFVTGLVVAGGLMVGGLTPALAGPSQLAGDGLTATARFEQCTEGSNPKKCKPIQPEEPSKRGGKPKQNPPRGGGADEPPTPPRGGGADEPPTPPRGGGADEPPRVEEREPRTIRPTVSDSEPFTATYLEIPVVESDGVFLQPKAAKPQAVQQHPVVQPQVAQPLAQAPIQQPAAVESRPAVMAAPDTGIGPEIDAAAGMPIVLASLAALFGAGALFMWRRPVGLNDRR